MGVQGRPEASASLAPDCFGGRSLERCPLVRCRQPVRSVPPSLGFRVVERSAPSQAASQCIV